MELIGTKLSENQALADCWQKAVDGALEGKTLTETNYAEIYKSAQGRFWPIVEKDAAAKAFFEKHGFKVEGGISPALEADGVRRAEVSLGLDHMAPKANPGNWTEALNPDKIQLLIQADNTKLSHYEKKDPSLRRP